MLKEKPERLLQLEHMCSDDEMNSSNSSRGKPLLEDLIREEILRSKAREKEEKASNLSKVDCRQVPSCILFLHTPCLNFRIDTENNSSKEDELDKKDNDNPTKASTKPPQPSLVHSCWSCDKPGRSLLKCSACRKARYCGEACQWEDWGRQREWCRRRGQMRERREKRKQRRSLDFEGKMKIYEDEEVD